MRGLSASAVGVLCYSVWSLVFVPGTRGYSSGAPEGRCGSMVPGHITGANSYTDPYTITLSASTYSPLQLITVTVTPMLSGVYIRGLILQARASSARDSSTTLGYFTDAVSGTQTQCNSGALTHSRSEDRSNVTAYWRAPASPQGDIVFRATVVRKYADVYTEIYSSSIQPYTVTLPPSTTTTATTPTRPLPPVTSSTSAALNTTIVLANYTSTSSTSMANYTSTSSASMANYTSTSSASRSSTQRDESVSGAQAVHCPMALCYPLWLLILCGAGALNM